MARSSRTCNRRHRTRHRHRLPRMALPSSHRSPLQRPRSPPMVQAPRATEHRQHLIPTQSRMRADMNHNRTCRVHHQQGHRRRLRRPVRGLPTGVVLHRCSLPHPDLRPRSRHRPPMRRLANQARPQETLVHPKTTTRSKIHQGPRAREKQCTLKKLRMGSHSAK